MPVLATGLDEDRAWRGVDVRQVEEEKVQLLPNHPLGAILIRERLVQPQVFDRLIQSIELHLIASDRLLVAGVAGDPGEDRFSLLNEQVANVHIRQRR